MVFICVLGLFAQLFKHIWKKGYQWYETYNRIWLHSWLSEACSPMNSEGEEAAGSMNRREDSTVSPEWLEALVKDVDMETSSSQEELELGFGCCWCHGLQLLLLVHEEREHAWWSSHQPAAAAEEGVQEEIATELSQHSWAISLGSFS